MKIGLFCAAGFSTGMLVNNMKVAAKELGIDAEIDAYSQAKLADFAPGNSRARFSTFLPSNIP